MKNIIKTAIAALAAALGLSACSETEIGDYINLSVETYTFNSGSDSLVVTVETNAPEWTAAVQSPFISLGTKTGTSIVISVEPNGSDEYLNGTVRFAAGTAEETLNISQAPKSYIGPFKDLPIQSMGAMSRNGKYYAWINTYLISENDWDDECFIMNLETGEITEMPVEPCIWTDTEGYYDSCLAISDDGRTMILEHKGSMITELYVDGERVTLNCQPGYYNPWITGISADGSVIVGGVKKENDMNFTTFPCKWVNGEHIILDMPETDAIGWPMTNGVYLRGCSADGSVIFGSEWQTFGVVYYKDDRLYNIGIENSEAEGESVPTIIYMQASSHNMSPSGKYFGATYRLDGVDYPCRINTQTGTFEYLENAANCGGSCATDDGLLFGCTPTYMATSGVVCDFNAGTTESLSDYMQRVHGLNVSNDRWVEQISSDGRAMGGRHYTFTALGAQYPYWFMSVD